MGNSIYIPDKVLYQKSDRENEYCGFRKVYLDQYLTGKEKDLVICKKCCGIMREPSLCNRETTCLVCSESPDKLNTVKAVQSSVSIVNTRYKMSSPQRL